MDTLHAVNLALVREFNARDIEFAFPTQTVYLAGGSSTATAGSVQEP